MHAMTGLIVSLLLVDSASMSAQERPGDLLRDGMRVRVTAPGALAKRASGTVQSRDSIGFLLVDPRPNAATWVPWSTVQTIEVSEGKSRAPWVLGGVLLGPILGVALGAGVCSFDTGPGACLAPVGGGIGGLVIGPLLGALVAPERWRRLP